MVQVAWLFWFSKIIELMDTVSQFTLNLTSITAPSLLSTAGLHLIRILCPSDLLCAEEKTWPDHLLAYLPPLLNALDLVVGSWLRSW